MLCSISFQVKSSKYGHNTVIFGLVDGYYGAPPIQNQNEVSAIDCIIDTTCTLIGWEVYLHESINTVVTSQLCVVAQHPRGWENSRKLITNPRLLLGLHNCLELSLPLLCLHQAMQTQKMFFIAYCGPPLVHSQEMNVQYLEICLAALTLEFPIK